MKEAESLGDGVESRCCDDTVDKAQQTGEK